MPSRQESRQHALAPFVLPLSVSHGRPLPLVACHEPRDRRSTQARHCRTSAERRSPVPLVLSGRRGRRHRCRLLGAWGGGRGSGSEKQRTRTERDKTPRGEKCPRPAAPASRLHRLEFDDGILASALAEVTDAVPHLWVRRLGYSKRFAADVSPLGGVAHRAQTRAEDSLPGHAAGFGAIKNFLLPTRESPRETWATPQAQARGPMMAGMASTGSVPHAATFRGRWPQSAKENTMSASQDHRGARGDSEVRGRARPDRRAGVGR